MVVPNVAEATIYGPVQERPELFGNDLQRDQHDQRRQEYCRTRQIAPVQGHGDRVAAGFAERCRRYLDDPEAERDRGDLCGCFVQIICIARHAAANCCGKEANVDWGNERFGGI
jgi:hypothetical protein